MKYEWRKQEKAFYGTKKKAEIVTIPPQKFLTITGEGDPNNEAFSERVGTLYPVAWKVKMGFKKFLQEHPERQSEFDYSEFTIFPLEGIWSTKNVEDLTDKASFVYKIMLRQPDWITLEMFETARAEVEKKSPNDLLQELSFETIEDGKCVQILHQGSFDEEPVSFQKMDQLVEECGLERKSFLHREIYLTDTRKTAPEKRRTLLRYQVK